MTLKNSEKVAAAEKVAEHARQVGFPGAYLAFEVPDEETFYNNLDDVVADREDEEVVMNIHLILDEEIALKVDEDGEMTYS